MVWQIILCALAACGILLVLWVVVGAMLMPFAPKNSCMIFWVRGNEKRLEMQLRAYGWLLNTGLVRSRLLLIAADDEEAKLAETVTQPYPWAGWIQPEGIETIMGENDSE